MKFTHYLRKDGSCGIFIGLMLAATAIFFAAVTLIFEKVENADVQMTALSFVYLALWLAYTVLTFVRRDKIMAKTAALILGAALFCYFSAMGSLENVSKLLGGSLYQIFLLLAAILSAPVVLMSGLPYLGAMYLPMTIPSVLFSVFFIYILLCKYKSRDGN